MSDTPYRTPAPMPPAPRAPWWQRLRDRLTCALGRHAWRYVTRGESYACTLVACVRCDVPPAHPSDMLPYDHDLVRTRWVFAAPCACTDCDMARYTRAIWTG